MLQEKTMPELIPLLEEVDACTLCAEHLPLPPRPVLQAGEGARILIIGQAPGLRAHESVTPWNDLSGDRLRDWMQVTREQFYDPQLFAIVPMGFCYPGKGKSGDLPPRKECAPQWHAQLLEQLPDVSLTLLIGQYAQNYYLRGRHKSLTERVKNWRDQPGDILPLPHPSPRNIAWFQRNPWFSEEVIPELRRRVAIQISLA